MRRTSFEVSPGAMLETTLMTPAPPSATKGRIVKSSPDKSTNGFFASTSAKVSVARCMFAVASLTLTIAPASTRRATVSGIMSLAVRPGTL